MDSTRLDRAVWAAFVGIGLSLELYAIRYRPGLTASHVIATTFNTNDPRGRHLFTAVASTGAAAFVGGFIPHIVKPR